MYKMSQNLQECAFFNEYVQMDNSCLCLATIEELQIILVKNFRKLCTEVTYGSSGIVFKDITLNLPLQPQKQGTGTSQSLVDSYDHFADIAVIRLTTLTIVLENKYYAKYADWCRGCSC